MSSNMMHKGNGMNMSVACRLWKVLKIGDGYAKISTLRRRTSGPECSIPIHTVFFVPSAHYLVGR
jgi:hypothetical protein